MILQILGVKNKDTFKITMKELTYTYLKNLESGNHRKVYPSSSTVTACVSYMFAL